ncbi:MAG: leucyl/phenylalanyl-tRNA--protein transferase [Alphaproteobacteria bacterium]|nr:leucyl/phenylalanyl-tRNA--protein transferase [Alphaproteobacteria bacterium]
MAESADDLDYNFYKPKMRGQLSVEKIHIPKRLLRTLKTFPYEIKINISFADVINSCAKLTDTRQETWINKPIRDTFIQLHEMGYAHSVECWENKTLVGGLYGLALGSIFCGESMFSSARDASKIALIHLCARLWKGGFNVLDTQFTNSHLEQFGIYEISDKEYDKLLHGNIDKQTDFLLAGTDEKELLEEYLVHHSSS